MSYRELFVSPPLIFAGFQKTFQDSDYIILGVPLDVTSTYRSGSKFAPSAIREASLNIETYSFRAGFDAEDLRLHDLGDLHVTAEVDETLKRTELVVKELIDDGKKLPVIIGGEHTITLGAMRAFGSKTALVSFDAHLDLRNEYMGRTICHATFMRRAHEQIRPEKTLEIGVRATCKEELAYAEKSGIKILTAGQIRKDGAEKTIKNVVKALADCEKIYLTIDMDVLDPAFAPAVQNPEPDGLSMHIFLDILCGFCDNRIVAFDVVEVAPQYDSGATSIQAAKTIFEILCHIEKSRRKHKSGESPRS
jgi:agmatinase